MPQQARYEVAQGEADEVVQDNCNKQRQTDIG